MSWLSRARVALRSAVYRRTMERDMETELRFHLSSYADDLVRTGLPRDEAERRARIEFGHPEPLKEECRQARGLRLLDETSQDLRYAFRMLCKSPGFSAIAALTLALGIGANTSIFSPMNAWVLRPLPYPDPGQLVAIASLEKKQDLETGVAAADVEDWRRENRVFEEMSAWDNAFLTLTRGDEAEQILGARVNASFLHMLGVRPVLGRDLLPQDDQPGAPPVALIGQEFWQTHYGSDPGLLGKTIRVEGSGVTVVGIVPDSFHLPLLGKPEVWMPLALNAEELKNRRALYLRVIARLKPGVRLSSAISFLAGMDRRLENTYPESNRGRGTLVLSLQDEVAKHGAGDQVVAVFGLVACVLLIACANVANLVVGRAVSRKKEMAVRLAIGAGRGRLLRQLLTENLVLFLLGGSLSVLFAMWGVRWIGQSIPADVRDYLPNHGALHVDGPTLCYTLAIAVVSGLVFGLAPAFKCSRIDVNHALKGVSSRSSAGSDASRLRNCLIVFELSLSLVVLIASGLLVKSLLRMYGGELGFNPSGVTTARLVLTDAKHADGKKAAVLFQNVLDQIRSLPGISNVAAANVVPYARIVSLTTYAIDGRAASPRDERPYLMWDPATPDYFVTLGIPLLRGRLLSEQDREGTPRVAIINETLAQRSWPGEDPIGRRIRVGANLQTLTIVGLVKDTAGQDETPIRWPQAYVPYAQFPTRGLTLVVRAAPGATGIAAEIRRAVAAVDKTQAVNQVQTMEGLMASIRAPFLIVSQVASLFAGLSLLLAGIGIYGVMAYSVAARKQEFGIRLALGAGRGNLLSLVIGQGLKLAAFGLVIGLLGSFAVTRFLSSVLYQVSPTDLPTFALISLLLLSVAALACYLPARRASGVEPVKALRHE